MALVHNVAVKLGSASVCSRQLVSDMFAGHQKGAQQIQISQCGRTHLEDAWLMARDVGDSNDEVAHEVDQNNWSKASAHTTGTKPLSHEDENDDCTCNPHNHACKHTMPLSAYESTNHQQIGQPGYLG